MQQRQQRVFLGSNQGCSPHVSKHDPHLFFMLKLSYQINYCSVFVQHFATAHEDLLVCSDHEPLEKIFLHAPDCPVHVSEHCCHLFRPTRPDWHIDGHVCRVLAARFITSRADLSLGACE
jgi:hypothetical protein